MDATIIRTLLVPATMRLLGRWNWRLPGRPPPIESGSRGAVAPPAHRQRTRGAGSSRQWAPAETYAQASLTVTLSYQTGEPP